jgi:hypothetical protein
MKSFRGRLPGLIAAVLLTGLAVAQNSLTPVPECGVPEIKNDTLFIVNSCGINVTSFYTSRGDVWGGTIISPGQEHRTAYSGEAIARVGGVSVYTCPGNGTPVQPDGSSIIGDYSGRAYACHGSEGDQSAASGLGRTVQPQPIPQPQIQRTYTNPAPSNPTDTVVIIPVQQPDNAQQDSEDDDDRNADANEDNGTLMQQYSQTLQNMINMTQSNSVQRVAPPAQGRPGPGCTYCWK